MSIENISNDTQMATPNTIKIPENTTKQANVSKTTNMAAKTADIIERKKIYPEYKPTISEKVVIEAIEQANKKLSGIQTEFEFSIHDQTKEIMVKVLDKDTKEIVREIPPEKVLDMVAKLWEMAGIIVDEKR